MERSAWERSAAWGRSVVWGLTLLALAPACGPLADGSGAPDGGAPAGEVAPPAGGSFAPADSAPGFLAHPRTQGPHPAVLIAHGREDLAEDLRALATSMADSGFVALLLPPIRSRPDDLEGVAEGFEFLRSRPYVRPERLAVVGFCGGGYQALLWAARSPPGLEATVAFYGPLVFPQRFQPEAGDPLASVLAVADGIGVPVQAHYGREDHIIPVEDAEALERILSGRGTEIELFLYDGAEHGFWDRTHGHHLPAAADAAERRMFAFLRQHLSGR